MTSHNAKTKNAIISIQRFSRLWSVAFLLFGNANASTSITASSSTTTTNNSNSNSNNNESQQFVSLKLTSHHAELERRQRELRQRHLSSVGVDGIIEVTEEEEEPQDRYRRREEAVQVGALFEGYGTHYVDLWCGSPPQRQTVIVDTGSGVTAFPCSNCKDCGAPNYHVDRLFVEKESKTFDESTCKDTKDCIMSRSNCVGTSCKISMSYAEGSRWNAYEAVDKCYVAGLHETPLVAVNGNKNGNTKADDMNPLHAADLAFDMTFGCQTLVTGLFKTQLADGIMGMSNQPSTFWSQMFEKGKMGNDQQFALCFSRPPTVTKEGTEAGAMTLGGCDDRLHKTPMVFTPSFDSGRSSFFSVKVRKMMLRDAKYGESAKSTANNPNLGVTVLNFDPAVANKGGIIVDSGTTDTYWYSGIAKEFKRVFQEKAGFAHTNSGMSLTEDQLKALPTILVQLYSDDETNGHVDNKFKTPGLAGAMDTANPYDVILAIPPSHYMEYNSEKDYYTNRFYPTERSGSVLGANAMMGHDVFFDMDTKRIGWAESDCDYTRTVKDSGYAFDITGKLKNTVQKVRNNGIGGGKNKNNNNNNDSDAAALCEKIKGGNKCQKTEGCTWGWGKCTKKSGTDSTTTTGTTTEAPTGNPTGSGSSTETTTDPATNIDIDTLLQNAEQHRFQIVIFGSVFVLLMSCCCWYCLCCSNRHGGRSKGKYAQTALAAVAIEMTDNGDRFQDEPGNKNDHDNSSNKSRNRTSSSFRDNPSNSKPEFDGDFA